MQSVFFRYQGLKAEESEDFSKKKPANRFRKNLTKLKLACVDKPYLYNNAKQLDPCTINS